MTTAPLLEVVVVTYRSRFEAGAELLGMLDLASANRALRWTFVDNSEDGLDAAWLEPLIVSAPNVAVVRRPDNPGFAAAVNIVGLESAAEWIVLVNPDVTLDTESLKRLADVLRGAPREVASVAVSLRTRGMLHEGVTFNTAGWFLDRVLEDAAAGRRAGRSLLLTVAGGRSHLIGPSGGAGAYRRTVFQAAGGFFEGLESWGEDAELGLRLWLAGHACLGLDLRLPHKGGHSVLDIEIARRRAFWLARNRVMIAARLYTLPQMGLFALYAGVIGLARLPALLRRGTLGADLAGTRDGLRRARTLRAGYAGPRLGLSARRSS